MSVDTIYDPTPKITTRVPALPEKGGEDRVDDFDERVPN
jgi:hypothetical protein